MEVVCFRKGSRDRSVVLVPGLGADAPQMAPLASGIGGAGAIYLVNLLSLADASQGAVTVETLARQALTQLRELGGADVFVGYSFGGLVALEMGRLARDDGSARVILIDAAPEQSHWPRGLWLLSIWMRVLVYTKNLVGLSPRQAITELVRRAKGLRRRLGQRRAAQNAFDPKLTGERSSAIAKLLKAYLLYRPSRFHGQLTLIECSDPSFATPVSRVWRSLAYDLQVFRYWGDHLDAVISQASTAPLAALLNDCIEAVGGAPQDCARASSSAGF